MSEKGNQGQGKGEEIVIGNLSDSVNAYLTSTTTLPLSEPRVEIPLTIPDNASTPNNNDSTTTKPAQPRKSQLKRRRKSVPLHLQTIALTAAITAIPLAYWQGTLQSSHSKFERNQRVVELSLTLAAFWDTQLDHDTRYRVGRFIAKLKSLKTDEEKKSLVSSLLENNNLLDSVSIPQNKLLYELIEPDLSSDNFEGSRLTPVRAVSRYRAALIKTLNTMEIIAIVKEHSKELPEALKVLDTAYAGTIQQRYKDLIPFIEEYRMRTNVGRRSPAWEPLTKMVEEEDRKLNEPVTIARP